MNQSPDDFDDGMSFGEVEEAQPDQQLRPDQNKHYAVVAVYDPSQNDLPIYVDVDVLRDMETHALSDTNVELGGVMLGGQYVDSDGNPFVVITDSLRAHHYESTKGSFKFTHETWSKISREREEFPDDLQMVGWYHTHPDWGVFLSGMDMFICDNFFNKSLDVALVIDPCRQDRGMFMWTPQAATRVRRTDGFYLIGSRFREYELQAIASQLEDEIPMADPRFSHSAPQVIQVGGGNSATPPWLMAAVLGMLAMQMALLGLLALKLLAPPDEDANKKLTKLSKQVEALAEANHTKLERDAQLRVLDRVVSEFSQGGRPDPISLLTRKDTELAKAQQDLEIARTAGKLAIDDRLQTQLTVDTLNDQLASLDKKHKKVVAERDHLKKLSEKQEDQDGAPIPWWVWAASAAGFFVIAALGAMFIGRKEEPPPQQATTEPVFSDSEPPTGEESPPGPPPRRPESEGGA